MLLDKDANYFPGHEFDLHSRQMLRTLPEWLLKILLGQCSNSSRARKGSLVGLSNCSSVGIVSTPWLLSAVADEP